MYKVTPAHHPAAAAFAVLLVSKSIHTDKRLVGTNDVADLVLEGCIPLFGSVPVEDMMKR